MSIEIRTCAECGVLMGDASRHRAWHAGRHDYLSITDIGDRILRLRRKRGWSAEELARRSGVSRDVIANIETARRKDVGVTQMTAIARALAVSIGDLTEEREDIE
jgi:ribosome-binding protein aMBF1 (putative translation factor)